MLVDLLEKGGGKAFYEKRDQFEERYRGRICRSAVHAQTPFIMDVQRYHSPPLLDLLSLQAYRLVIHEYSLPLVRLRHSPRSDLRRELLDHLLLYPLQEYPRWLRTTGLHA